MRVLPGRWRKHIIPKDGEDMGEKQYYCKLRLSYKGAFDTFTDTGAAALIRAIMHHATGDNMVEIPGEIAPTWAIIKDDLDRDKDDFENGKKGGRPKVYGIQPDEDAEIDNETRLQAIKYGFSEVDSDMIGRFKNTPAYRRFVDEAMKVCWEREKTSLSYFKGVLFKKTG